MEWNTNNSCYFVPYFDRDLGMSESLFARLDECGATFDLNLQYRMNR